MIEYKFSCAGTPVQGGSKKAFLVRKAGVVVRAAVTDDAGKPNRAWMAVVRDAAERAMEGRDPTAEPVAVRLVFRFIRPSSHFGSGRNAAVLKPSAPVFHAQTPDVDKLVRLALDACTGVVWRDDKQVVCPYPWRVWAPTAGLDVAVLPLVQAFRTLEPMVVARWLFGSGLPGDWGVGSGRKEGGPPVVPGDLFGACSRGYVGNSEDGDRMRQEATSQATSQSGAQVS
jgi:Holliday junction resolvase RusA-like endonuclease